ncbi:hypothetical protein UPYG_G00184230 [Umbra pygmaea]|uniref:Selenoprotein F/M domain-containing protein n=1 Tax=Umbra pygmaea TaxID=75934 RepID=A0ABD0WW35_UMBPY
MNLFDAQQAEKMCEGGVMRWMTAEQAKRGQSLCYPGHSSLAGNRGVKVNLYQCCLTPGHCPWASHVPVCFNFLCVTLDSCHPSHNLVLKHIPGADPELVLLSHYYEELDRIDLSEMTRSEINELLEKLGFYKKAQAEDEVPEEFRFSPAKYSPFKETAESQASATPVPTHSASSPESDTGPKHSDL